MKSRFHLFLIISSLWLTASPVLSAATRTVRNTQDSGPDSLRQAVAASAAGDSIVFDIPTTDSGYNSASRVFTIVLASEIQIGRNLNIVGLADGKLAISGNNMTRIFRIVAGTVNISDVTITSGRAAGANGANGAFGPPYQPVGSGSPAEAGGIMNAGTLTLEKCGVVGNVAAGGNGGDGRDVSDVGGAGGAATGGGIVNTGTLVLVNSSVLGNLAQGGLGGPGGGPGGGAGGAAIGGGIANTGTLTLVNSTVSDNAAYGGSGGRGNCCGGHGGSAAGGGISNAGSMALTNATVSGNQIVGGNGAVGFGDSGNGGNATGGGFSHSGAATKATLRNTIVAGNTATAGSGGPSEMSSTPGTDGTAVGPDVAGEVTSRGHNLIGRSDGNSGWLASDLLGGTTDATRLDPLLAPARAVNGGNWVQPLLAGSAAINAGDDVVLGPPLSLTTDQRGLPRKQGAHVDIGAFEFDPPQSDGALVVNTTSEHDDNVCGRLDCTLLEALNAANANADASTVEFEPGLSGTIRNSLVIAGLNLVQPVTIKGPGARALTISGSLTRIFYIHPGVEVTISGVTMANGDSVSAALGSGGAIFNQGDLTLQSCTVRDNSGGSGGGVANEGSLKVQNSTFTRNQSTGHGGAIRNVGTATVTNSTFYQNSAASSGAITSSSAGATAASLTLRNCTVVDNLATTSGSGGGIFNLGGASTIELSNTLVAGNSASNGQDLAGEFVSADYNLIQTFEPAHATLTGPTANTKFNVNPALGSFQNNGGPTNTMAILLGSPAINGAGGTAPATDQRGFNRVGAPDIGAFEFAGTLPVTLANISTRLRVETGNNVLIGGFIITGNQPKKVLVRGIGPSLSVAGKLADPQLEIYDSGGNEITRNDNWKQAPNRQAIIGTGIPPTHQLESAVLTTLNPGAYTAIMRGVGGGTGIGLVEVYDLDRTANAKLANISTRGVVQTGDDVMIGGFIVLGSRSQKVVIRAIGPSLPVAGKLANPLLELRDRNGVLLQTNDNWRTDQEAEIIATGVPPSSNLESAIVRTLSPAAYTAIVRGVNNTTGIALVEVYALE